MSLLPNAAWLRSFGKGKLWTRRYAYGSLKDPANEKSIRTNSKRKEKAKGKYSMFANTNLFTFLFILHVLI